MQDRKIELGNYDPSYEEPQNDEDPKISLYQFQKPEEPRQNQVPSQMDSENMLMEEEEVNDPPLLEDLGIDPAAVKDRVLQIFKLTHGIDRTFFEDTDLSGPLLVAILFGVFLMLVFFRLSTTKEWQAAFWIYLRNLCARLFLCLGPYKPYEPSIRRNIS